jgi:ABC-type Na+ efflux pump permease subunit
MRRVNLPVLSGAVGLALVGLGVVYFAVACESLPGFLGGTPGDTSPRTGLGVVAVVLALAAFGLSAWFVRRRSQGE